ncbi:pre-mRNA-splicing factor ISY1 homolog isoform X2 [Pectinophora gossypiella]|uniref:pre-mRNA-splicing factor ISY1 homolog isoform X2 n=1 Tax=Pectinophora gossypiella TaxID=13191 RepID=UPI00214E20E0|nr:pre-mRNA-splicing factor ISY1 homolog isoform X2 [Pectinophora gossypiella]
MARNAEKAMTTLARWRAAQVQEAGGQRERRPYLASECNDLQQAEKWRLQIVREIAKKVAQIQNAGLGEFRIRDLNDEINKLMREKRHWEVQIKLLGGPDHARVGPKMLDQDGKEVPGNRGYKYFGAAKDLPAIARAVAEWRANKEENKEQDLPEEENIYPEDPDDKRIEQVDGEPAPVLTSHVAVPSQKDIEEALLRRKKQELLERYGCLDVKLEDR